MKEQDTEEEMLVARTRWRQTNRSKVQFKDSSQGLLVIYWRRKKGIKKSSWLLLKQVGGRHATHWAVQD